jgi:hypothetical protein
MQNKKYKKWKTQAKRSHWDTLRMSTGDSSEVVTRKATEKDYERLGIKELTESQRQLAILRQSKRLVTDNRCKGLTKLGKPCKAPPRKGLDFCPQHKRS